MANHGSPLCKDAFAFVDVNIYEQCAQWMHSGLVLYRNMFDHKGPLTYLFFYAGLCAGPAGLWLLQVAWNTLSAELCFRLCRLFAPTNAALTAVLIFIAELWLIRGFETQAFLALPFIALGLLPLLRPLWAGELPTWRGVLVAALCCVALFLLKPDLAAPIAVAGLYIIYQAARRGEWLRLALWTGIFASAFTVAFAALFRILSHYGAWEAYIDCAWQFNFQYSAQLPSWQKALNTLTGGLLKPSVLWLWVLSAALLCRLHRGPGWRTAAGLTALSLASILLLEGLSGRALRYYPAPALIPLAALVALALAAQNRQRASMRSLQRTDLPTLAVAAMAALLATLACNSIDEALRMGQHPERLPAALLSIAAVALGAHALYKAWKRNKTLALWQLALALTAECALFAALYARNTPLDTAHELAKQLRWEALFAIALLTVGLSALHKPWRLPRWLLPATTLTLIAAAQTHEVIARRAEATEVRALAEFVEASTTQGDCVLLGVNTYRFTQRTPASRYAFTFLMLDNKERREALRRDLLRNHPRIIEQQECLDLLPTNERSLYQRIEVLQGQTLFMRKDKTASN